MKILKLEEATHAPLKCVVSICVEKWGNFVIEDVRLFEEGPKKWFHFPSKTYEKEGVQKHFYYNRMLDRKMLTEFNRQLFRAADEYIMNKYNSGNDETTD